MYLFLLLLGAAISMAGIALIGTGVSFQEHTLDTTTITPGAVAVIGGLLLVGLGLTVRMLQRIERALEAKSLPRSAQLAEPGEGIAESANAAPRIPFPPRPVVEPRPQPVPVASAAPAATEAAGSERLREKFPALVRAENAPVVEEAAISLSPKTPARAEDDLGAVSSRPAQNHVNGAALAKTALPVETNAAAAHLADRSKGSMFDTLWPKAQRRDARAAAAIAAAPLAQTEPAPASALLPDAVAATAPHRAPVPVSILKSGVVDGMAYTLYSDGSIEAQLPQGTLRFGSITELRNHIEQSA